MRTRVAQRMYMRKYYANPKNRAIKKKRDNDRNSYIRKNGKIPKWKELHHTWNRWTGKKVIVKRKTNRSLWAKLTNRVRKKVN